jgi:HD-GYP domain-containing protein (c-di-GMP phosphodiesterase class II)
VGPSAQSEGVRLAELMAALSLATDIGTGAEMEHAQRSAILCARLSDAAGLSEGEARDAYYLALLKTVGCTGDQDYAFGALGEDMGQWAGAMGMASSLEMMRGMVRNTGRRERPLRRAGMVANAFVSLPGMMGQSRIHSEVGRLLAGGLGLTPGVQHGLGQVFEHWDGSGSPWQLKGEAIALPVRVAQLCADLGAAEREGGRHAAVALARRRSGRGYDPRLVELFVRKARSLLSSLETPSAWDAVLAAEPGAPERLDGERVDRVVRAMGEYADLKSRFVHGHSAAVAELAGAAAQRLRLDPGEVRATRRAGHLHHLGRVGVLSRIWDKPGTLTDGERERVRMHSCYTERILARLDGLAPAPALTALAHDQVHERDRRDGSGNHRRLPSDAVPAGARAIAAADVYHALVSNRPHRPATPRAAAAAELRRLAGERRLDCAAVEAVLMSAGQASAQPRAPRARGLSTDELAVLRLLARGLSNGEVAIELGLSPKAARSQVEQVFEKIGVSTRPAAALFAMQNDLIL